MSRSPDSNLPKLPAFIGALTGRIGSRAAAVARRLPVPVLEWPGGRGGTDDTVLGVTDRETTLQLMEELSSRARVALGEPPTDPPLPHPLTTDRNLSTFLDRASAARMELGGPAGSGRPQARTRARIRQDRFNDSIIHCLHQLDHRGRQDRARMLEIELELADALARVRHLERRLDRSDDEAGVRDLTASPTGPLVSAGSERRR